MEFTSDYSRHFIARGRNSVGHARHYLSGLLGTQRRKNIETIDGDLPGSDYQGLEQFISSSPWDEEGVLDQVAWDADGLLGGHPDSAFYLDESAFSKKGKGSAGVKSQYNGRLGTKDNCQVGVFGCLGRGHRVCLTDARLFLPEDWTKDEERCRKVGVPLEQRVFKTKLQLAKEIVTRARQRGVRFNWLGFDALYGRSHAFTNALEDAGEHFVGDVQTVTKVWTRSPADPDAERLTVHELCQREFAAHSREYTLRAGTKGPLRVQGWARRVWLSSKDYRQPRERWLIASQDKDGDFRYSLSNCLEINDPARLLYMQHQRYWIEHAFREAKSQLGMAQYQVRVWRGWHHHMTMISLAMLFTLKEQILQAEEVPLLSMNDITVLLDYYLPRTHHDKALLYSKIAQGHRRRQADIDRRMKRAEVE